MNSSSNASQTLHPMVRWAQRKDKVYVTIHVEDCTEPAIKVGESSLHFKGKGGPDHVTYEVLLEFFKDIDPQTSNQRLTGRDLFFVLKKKEAEDKYWPRLLKDTKKVHYLKTDFEKWKDEDESDGEDQEDFNLDEMMQSMGGLQGAGAGDLPGGEEEEDSDDEDLPDLQQ